jgi:hypothetical protein
LGDGEFSKSQSISEYYAHECPQCFWNLCMWCLIKEIRASVSPNGRRKGVDI